MTAGCYKTGLMYKAISGDFEQTTWKRILLNNHARPKACFALWMALWKRLPTKERLMRFGIIDDHF